MLSVSVLFIFKLKLIEHCRVSISCCRKKSSPQEKAIKASWKSILMFQSDGIRNIFFNRLKQQQRKEKNEVTKFDIHRICLHSYSLGSFTPKYRKNTLLLLF